VLEEAAGSCCARIARSGGVGQFAGSRCGSAWPLWRGNPATGHAALVTGNAAAECLDRRLPAGHEFESSRAVYETVTPTP
jgi:hypothetical protein